MTPQSLNWPEAAVLVAVCFMVAVIAWCSTR